MSEITGVFDENFNPLFASAQPMKAIIQESAKALSHPLETGASITDHRVFLPVEIELVLFLREDEYKDIYKQIGDVYRGNKTVTVQTKTNSYPNMLLQAMPHDETADMLKSVIINLKFIEVLLISTQFEALPPRAARIDTDASTTQRGEQSPEPAKRVSRLRPLW